MSTVAQLLLPQQATDTIRGTVTDALTHQAVGHARVTGAGSRDVTADEGSYSLKDVPAGEAQVRIALAGYRQLDTATRVGAGGLVKQDFELHPLARITGRVTDKDSGEPIDRPVLVREKTGGVLGVGKRIDDKGGFEIIDLEADDYTLESDGFDATLVRLNLINTPDQKKPRKSYGEAVCPETIDLEEGATRFIEIRLSALEAHFVAGSVVIPEGHDSETLAVTFRFGRGNSTMLVAVRRPGPFRINGRTRGEYILAAQIGKPAMQTRNKAHGRLLLNVTDHDMDDAKLTLAPSTSFSGVV